VRSLAAVALLVALLAGCGRGVGGPVARLPTSQNVGSLVHRWAESDSAEAPGVRAIRRGYLEPQLITTKAAWSRFVHGLPSSLRDEDARDDLGRVDLRNSVVVVAAYGKCTEISHVERRGDAELAFVVTSKPRVNCAWSPTQLEVWRVSLEEAGVTDRSKIHLAD